MFTSEYYKDMEAKIPKGNFRTRFAPSPTGYMHIGNLRTALYGYLLARNANGSFLLRIEDTDQERYVEGASDFIFNTLADAGLEYDEGPGVGGPVGPYIQSERKDIYKAYAELLIARNHAYRCFCEKETHEEEDPSSAQFGYDGRCGQLSESEININLEKNMPYVVRQRIPKEGFTSFDDVVFGPTTVPNKDLDDQVLLKRDGMATYNFSNVVDDHLMGITHVIRGSEYLSSTPKYNLLYHGFGWDIPVYIHVSPIMRDANNKLSKRSGDASYDDYIHKGYLKDALLNYIALLGWSPGGEQEIYTKDELIKAFNIKGISKSPAIFDPVKLEWMNGQYLHALDPEIFYEKTKPYLEAAITRDVNFKYLATFIQSRCNTFQDIKPLVDFVDTVPTYHVDLYTHKKMKTSPELALVVLQKVLVALDGLTEWTQNTIHDALINLATEHEYKNGQVLWPTRIALTGKESTPTTAIETCLLLGKPESLNRIKCAIELLS